MQKPWRLTRQAEASLIDIARWTYENFGPKQATAYEEDLITRCCGIASATVPTQDCRSLIDPDLAEDLRFTRVGQHFIVYVEEATQIIIVDFLHSRSDLSARLAALSGQNPDPER